MALKYMYEQKRLNHQRLEYQMGYLAYLVGILFSKSARYKTLQDFMVFEEKGKNKPVSKEQILNACSTLFKKKSVPKQPSEEEIQKLTRLFELQAIYDGDITDG